MQLKTYNTIKDFLDENINLLEKDEIINNKIIGNLLYYTNYQITDKDLLLSITNNNLMFWAVSIRNNEAMISGSETCIDKFIDFIKQNNINLSGIFARKGLIDSLKDKYHKNIRIDMNTILYSLEKLNNIQLSSGYIRKIKESDKETVVSFLDGFLYDCFNQKDNIFSEKTFDKMLKEESLYVLEDNEITSIAGIVRRTKNTSTISYVYTPDRFRKKGYATSIVYELSKLILINGFKYSTLFADKNNPNSNLIYQKIGYKKIEEFLFVKIID